MQGKGKEKLYMLRLWQDDNSQDWRASLRIMSSKNEAARYFHSVDSLSKYIANNITNVSGEKS